MSDDEIYTRDKEREIATAIRKNIGFLKSVYFQHAIANRVARMVVTGIIPHVTFNN